MNARHWMPKLVGGKGLSLLSLLVALTAQSQWVPDGPPQVLQYQFMTAGGITYFRLVGLLSGGSCCQRIAAYEVTREGTNLAQVIEQEGWGGACIALYCDPWPEEVVPVLGALPPGHYTLTLLAESWDPWDPWFPPLAPFPWAVLSFGVPTNATPTLSVSTGASSSNPLALVSVAGVPKVRYVLESSEDLMHWTPVKTNVGGPVTFSVSMSNAPNRFYRAAIGSAP